MSRRSGAAKSQRPVTEEKEESGSQTAVARNRSRAHQRLPQIVLCHGPNHPKTDLSPRPELATGRLHPEPAALKNG
jgi:hypothetical protein